MAVVYPPVGMQNSYTCDKNVAVAENRQNCRLTEPLGWILAIGYGGHKDVRPASSSGFKEFAMTRSITQMATVHLVGRTALAALLMGLAANAQDGDTTIEEIIVSSQKRDENLRDVPVTISAFDQEILDAIGVDDFGELSEITPGVNVQLQSPNNPSFVIRGITSDDGNAQQSPRITLYYNGVDVSRARGSAFEIFDIERIEIVKGPQATLFGTAAQIGAFSVITARPQKEFDAEFYAGYGNFNYVKAGGFVTGGNDVVQGRLAAQLRRRDGFVTNIAGDEGSQTPIGPEADDLNGLETFAIRPSLRFTPSETVTIDLIATYERNDQPGTAFVSANFPSSDGSQGDFRRGELSGAFANNLLRFGGLSFNPAIGSLVPDLTTVSRDEIAAFLGRGELGLTREVFDLNTTLNWRINDHWDFTAIAAYREFDSIEVFDADGSQVPLLEISEIALGDQLSFEARAAYDYDGFRGFFGVNYFTEDNTSEIPTVLDETLFIGCANPLTGDFVPALCTNADGSFNRLNIFTGQMVPEGSAPGIFNETSSTTLGNFDVFSFFIDNIFEVSEKLEITTGVRFVFEEARSGIATTFTPSAAIFLQLVGAGVLAPDQYELAPFLQPVAVSTDGEFQFIEETFTDVLPRLNVLYKLSEDVNLYGTIARGSKRPAILISNLDGDLDNQLDIQFLSREVVWNYEVGFKTLLLDGKAEISASIFYQDYENFVVNQVLSTPAGIINTSIDAGSATNIGIELGARGQVNESLSLFGTFAWIDAQIDNTAENGTFAGNSFRLTPEFSGSAGFRYTHPIDDKLSAFLNGSWTYRSDVFFEESNQPIAGFPIGEGDVHQIDMRAGLRSEDGGWEVAAFVTNLTNEAFNIDGGNTGGGFGLPTFIPGEPRFYGAEIRFRY